MEEELDNNTDLMLPEDHYQPLEKVRPGSLHDKIEENAHFALDKLRDRLTQGLIADKDLKDITFGLIAHSPSGIKAKVASDVFTSQKMAEALVAGLGPLCKMAGMDESEIRETLYNVEAIGEKENENGEEKEEGSASIDALV